MARLSESPISLGSVKCFSAGEKRLWTGCPEHGAMPGQVGRAHPAPPRWWWSIEKAWPGPHAPYADSASSVYE